MIVLEKMHKIKRKIIKTYQKYFTIQHPETYILSDKSFIKKIYKEKMGKEINLSDPKTFCEKQNWLKLYDRKPIYTVMVDKYLAREFVAERIGEDYLVPLLGVWDSADDIDFSLLPDKFVLKCNHNSDVTICTDKSSLDTKKVRKKLNEQLKRDYYLRKREWPYKNVPRKIICEKFMENRDNSEPLEYKVLCFGGKPKYVIVISGRFSNRETTMDTYDMEWKYTSLINGDSPLAGNIFEKPECFDEIISISEKLSENTPFLRVDFNFWNEKLYFGEMTFFDAAGFEKYKPEEWDCILGDLIELPPKHRR